MNDWIADRVGLFYRILDFMMLREEEDDCSDDYEEFNDNRDIAESFIILLLCLGLSIVVIVVLLKLAHVM